MINFYSIKNYNFPYIPNVKKIAVKISGGADSSLIAYMLAKLKLEGVINSKLIAVTLTHPLKPYQIDTANRVINRINDLTGINYDYRITKIASSIDEYYFYKKNIMPISKKEYDYQFHYMGITANPPIDVGFDHPEVDRNHDKNMPIFVKDKLTPWVNYDKRDISSIYTIENIRHTLFPLTRSCVIETFDFSKHCGECWWCKERYWGFGSYE